MQSSPEQLAIEFLDQYRTAGVYSRDLISRLAQLAISDDADTAESATRAIFTGLVEPLADSFHPDSVSIYNRVFAQVLQVCRLDPRAEGLDRELRGFGLLTDEDVLGRAERLRRTTPLYGWRDWGRHVRRVVVLSRVTLGADIAITSVIINRLRRCFPVTQVVIGGGKLQELFGGDDRLTFKNISYPRAGGILARLLAWSDLIAAVREATADLNPGEFQIFDPDTRLTQLGLLPAIGPDPEPGSRQNYSFFPSREYDPHGTESISRTTRHWLNQIFDQRLSTVPSVKLRNEDLETALRLVKKIRALDSRPILAINFGVGENPAKRVGDRFEQELVASLIRSGAIVILDRGASKEEGACVDRIIAALAGIERQGVGVRIVELNEQLLATMPDRVDADLLTWDGRIGLLAALIAQSDLYVGYDSAGQHIAAALGVPCIDVFAGFNSERFVQRWRPTGPAEARIVTVERSQGSDTAERVLQHARELLQRAGFDVG